MPKKRFRIPVKDRCEHWDDDLITYEYKGKDKDGFSKLECSECHKVMIANGRHLYKNG